MANDRMYLPQSGGGIIRYFDEYKSKLEFRPQHIILMIIVVVVLEIILHAYGYSLLGLN
jgi:preprotein translocase subunit Sec61beta